MNRTLLVDASNLMYRVAYIPAFMNLKANGTPTGVVHGFFNSLFRYAKSNDNIIVAFDRRSNRKRKLYPAYKASRDIKDPIQQRVSDEVKAQAPIIKKILFLMGIRTHEIEGYEADEIIGTIASLSYDPCTILSEDKDFLQLVDERVNIYQPIRKRHINTRNFAEHYFGLTPAKYFYFRQLSGDTSDGIAGVPGCGIKTALEIVKKNHFQGVLARKLLKKNLKADITSIVNRNAELMLLNDDSVPEELLESDERVYERRDRLMDVLNRYELESVSILWSNR